MNVSENRDAAAASNNVDAPSAALLSALTTEHYTLQSARASTVTEANGRSLMFLSAVSGATVALALVAQLDRLGETFMLFALTILPALLALGVTSYARLADLAVHDAYYARAIGRIRSFYLSADPSARRYIMLSAGDDPHAIMRQTGDRHSRWHHLSHAATSVAAVTAVIAGVFTGLGLAVATRLPVLVSAPTATAFAVTAFAAAYVDQERRWRRSGSSEPTRFLPDGTPAMQVHGPVSARRAAPGAADVVSLTRVE